MRLLFVTESGADAQHYAPWPARGPAGAARLSRSLHDPGALADALVERLGRRIVLGLPVGLGKAVHVANALYDKVAADPSLHLTIFTALTLESPRAGSDLEERFLAPIVDRLYRGWPALRYAEAIRGRTLPPNIEVREFYFRPAAYLGTPAAQQAYTSVNYSHVVDELMRLGVNVVAQIVSARRQSPASYSLSCNPEIVLDLAPRLRKERAAGRPVAIVAQVNRQLPYMLGDAEVPRDFFDYVLDSPDCEFPLFGVPNRAVEPADYATGMHVASLIPDGGTIQLGIGSLSDAVAHCLTLRHEQPAVFRDVLARLPGGSRSPRRRELPLEDGRFEQGLYASSELVSDALFALFDRGILRRAAGSGEDTVLHGGFFLGSAAFYAALRELPEERRRLINMTAISHVNTLFGDEERKRRQRRDGRFINETMMVTLLGAAVSDGLEDGRVVSGVGGQFDFVAMAHALPEAMSILMVRARRIADGRANSNIRWSYGHTTVPRHFRDVYVSEYGIAAVRGRSDSEVIAAILDIADAEFQQQLRREAVAARKLSAEHRLSSDTGENRPSTIRGIFEDPALREYFPSYPLGTEFTAVEQELAGALAWLKQQTARPVDRLRLLLSAMVGAPAEDYPEHLQRLGLAAPAGIRQRISRRLVAEALSRIGL